MVILLKWWYFKRGHDLTLKIKLWSRARWSFLSAFWYCSILESVHFHLPVAPGPVGALCYVFSNLPFLAANSNLRAEVDVLLLSGIFAFHKWKILCYSRGILNLSKNAENIYGGCPKVGRGISWCPSSVTPRPPFTAHCTPMSSSEPSSPLNREGNWGSGIYMKLLTQSHTGRVLRATLLFPNLMIFFSTWNFRDLEDTSYWDLCPQEMVHWPSEGK